MKKLITLLLTLALALSLCACGAKTEEAAEETAGETAETAAEETQEAPENREVVMGTLSLLNFTEEESLAREKGKLVAITYLEEHGAYHSEKDLSNIPEISGVIFYDTLDAMLMALEAGDITSAEVPVCVADYLCARNDKLTKRGTYDLSGADDFTEKVAYRLGVGYSFLTKEEKTALRDEIDQALMKMKEDGTLDALIQTYITDGISAEPEPAEFTKTDGETFRVAVTGALPPMDYVAADGTPAGFNTALLAELGRRMNVNFELVQVDSLGRAAALASGNVDLVFWTNGADGRDHGGRHTGEEYAAFKEDKRASLTEEQIALMEAIDGVLDYEKIQNKDIPDGTIITQPYFSDLLVAVGLK
jgi:ABC-type amino acid transport substrate-binding protein